jgi:hypothetical protein
MELPDFTVEHLKQLPLRAIIAFATRCARRVEHLAGPPVGDPNRLRSEAVMEAALRLAEDFARGTDVPPDPSVVAAVDAIAEVPGGPRGSRCAAAAAARAAHAAASAWNAFETREAAGYRPLLGDTAEARGFLSAIGHATVDLAALGAFTAAAEAFTAVGYDNEGFVAAALNDYDRLLRLKLGSYPNPGDPIDPSPSGPLGRF